MTTAKSQKIVFTAGLLTFTIGFLNSILKNHTLPSRRFLVGSGVVYLGLSALSEVEPDVAAPLALAVLTTAMLGEGGGVLEQITPKKELDTTGKVQPADVRRVTVSEHDVTRADRAAIVRPADAFGIDRLRVAGLN